MEAAAAAAEGGDVTEDAETAVAAAAGAEGGDAASAEGGEAAGAEENVEAAADDAADDSAPGEEPGPADELGPDSAGHGAETVGISSTEESTFESAQELFEEGQAEEAALVQAVDNAPDADVAEVQTHE